MKGMNITDWIQFTHHFARQYISYGNTGVLTIICTVVTKIDTECRASCDSHHLVVVTILLRDHRKLWKTWLGRKETHRVKFDRGSWVTCLFETCLKLVQFYRLLGPQKRPVYCHIFVKAPQIAVISVPTCIGYVNLCKWCIEILKCTMYVILPIEIVLRSLLNLQASWTQDTFCTLLIFDKAPWNGCYLNTGMYLSPQLM